MKTSTKRAFRRMVAITAAAMIITGSGATAPKPVYAADLAPISLEFESGWNLRNIYANDGIWEEDFEKLSETTFGLYEYEGKLDTAQVVKEFFDDYCDASAMMFKLDTYIKLKYDMDKLTDLDRVRMDKIVSIESILQDIADMAAEQLFSIPQYIRQPMLRDPILADYAYFVNYYITQNNYQIEDREAPYPNDAYTRDQVRDALGSIMKPMGVINNNLLITVDNYDKFLTRHHSQEIRRNAAAAFNGDLEKNDEIYRELLFGSIRDSYYQAHVDGFFGALDQNMNKDGMFVQAYSMSLFEPFSDLRAVDEYVQKKKESLGYSELYLSDLEYTNLKSPSISYGDAKRIVMNSSKALGDEYNALLDKLLNEGYIRVQLTANRQNNEINLISKDILPYINIYYNNDLASVEDFAYTISVAMYRYLSAQNNAFPMSFGTTATNELAGSVGRMLCYEYMIDNATDNEQRSFYAERAAKSFIDGYYIPATYAIYEAYIHTNAAEGLELSAEQLNSGWLEALRGLYGDGMTVDASYKHSWSGLLNREPFYYYNYAASSAAAASVLGNLHRSSDAYIEFLKSGNSDYPVYLMQNAGADITSTKVFNDAYVYLYKLTRKM